MDLAPPPAAGWVLAVARLVNAVLCAVGLVGLVSADAADPASQVTSILPVIHRPYLAGRRARRHPPPPGHRRPARG